MREESYPMRMRCVPNCWHAEVAIKTRNATLYKCMNVDSPHFGEVFTEHRFICAYAATLCKYD